MCRPLRGRFSCLSISSNWHFDTGSVKLNLLLTGGALVAAVAAVVVAEAELLCESFRLAEGLVGMEMLISATVELLRSAPNVKRKPTEEKIRRCWCMICSWCEWYRWTAILYRRLSIWVEVILLASCLARNKKLEYEQSPALVLALYDRIHTYFWLVGG